MANVLIWGNRREIMAGDLPLGITVEEASTLSNLQAGLDGRATLVLVDPAHLERERAAVEAWHKTAGGWSALLVAVCEAAEVDDTIRRYPFLDDVVARPVTGARLRLRLERALDTINSRRVIQQLDEALARKSQDLHELNKIGVALSSQRDVEKLLELILSQSRAITAADAGSLYLVQRGSDDQTQTDDQLRFMRAQNDSVVVSFEERTMPLNESSVAGYTALTGHPVNLADAYHLPPEAPFQYSRSFDERSGYRTKSILAVPMRDHKGTVIGVVQLINKKRDAKAVLHPVGLVEEMVIPFTAVDAELVTSLASQAAVAVDNARLIEQIKKLFHSFVHASVKAIESRDPTTSGHSGRVADLTVGIAEAVDALGSGRFQEVRFTRDQLQEIRFASLLHDFGKVGVREKILIKGKKLYAGEMIRLQQRFAFIKRTLEAEHLRAKLDQVMAGRATPDLLRGMDTSYEERRAELDHFLQIIGQANEPTIVEEESFQALLSLPQRTFCDVDGTLHPYLTPAELTLLSIRRGSLSEEERREIESHVTHTFDFLSQIRWTGEYRRVPEIAYAHHEKLDGSGYPRRLSGDQIPIQSRMMTIADIFDALVAWDRPYKKSVPVARALDILQDEVKAGRLDRDLLTVFVEAKVYEKTVPQAGTRAELTR